jgi:hypothetical protein
MAGILISIGTVNLLNVHFHLPLNNKSKDSLA